MAMTEAVTAGSLLDSPPAGYELRTADMFRSIARRYYQAVSAVTANGVPGAVRREDALETFRAADAEVRDLICALGGDSAMPYRVRYTDGQLDYLAQMGGEETVNSADGT